MMMIMIMIMGNMMMIMVIKNNLGLKVYRRLKNYWSMVENFMSVGPLIDFQLTVITFAL